MRRCCLSLVLFAVFCWLTLQAAAPEGSAPLTNSRPLTAAETRATFAVPAGFRVELVAAEPNVVDPVAMTFDERGRLFVCEMRGYPNGGRGTGDISSGVIKLLEDRDGDGVYETATVWADGLRFPTGLTPWQGGLLTANAPDLVYLQDTGGKGTADRRTVLYTGFDVANIQQLLNSLQFAHDNWMHGVAGMAGGTITCVEKSGVPPVVLRGRGVRFRPDVPGSLEPTSGGGQYGLSADAWGGWFTATNSQHLRHIVLPDHYLRRNPALPVREVTLDIPEHGAACKVFRTSPFEAWRVERTTRRAGSADAKRFPSTELVPGGYVTSACSPLVYTADLFPARYHGSVFVCDPANNLILRDTLTPSGATWVAHRGHAETEFLTSTDNWFRPVHLTLGPDGAIYVLDFYREVIETPLSLPDDIKARLNLESRGRGRIWRITSAPPGSKPVRPALDRATTGELVRHLGNANSWWRLTAQRLLHERKPKDAVPLLTTLARDGQSPLARMHALWTLDGLGALEPAQLVAALKDASPGLREQALRLAERHLGDAPALLQAVTALTDDPSPPVRFQLAFSLGASDAPPAVAALARLAARPDNDPWTQTAILSAAYRSAGQLLAALAANPAVARAPAVAQRTMLKQLAAIVGTKGDDDDLARALALLGGAGAEPTPLQIALLDGLGEGLANGPRSLKALWQKPPAPLAAPLTRARRLFERTAALAADEKRAPAARAEAVRLLGRGPFAPLAEAAPALLAPRTPPEVQLATVRALSGHAEPRVAALLLDAWPAAGPTLRREMSEALFARRDRLAALLDALEKKQLAANQLDPVRLAGLRKDANTTVRARVSKLLAGQQTPARVKVIEEYRPALDLEADVARGKQVFGRNCAICHRLDDVGVQVGADLLAALRNKSPEQLLIDILDPSREVDPRYLAYQITTLRGQILTGLIAAETAASITLKVPLIFLLH